MEWLNSSTLGPGDLRPERLIQAFHIGLNTLRCLALVATVLGSCAGRQSGSPFLVSIPPEGVLGQQERMRGGCYAIGRISRVWVPGCWWGTPRPFRYEGRPRLCRKLVGCRPEPATWQHRARHRTDSLRNLAPVLLTERVWGERRSCPVTRQSSPTRFSRANRSS
jgi:hypothetical protein